MFTSPNGFFVETDSSTTSMLYFYKKRKKNKKQWCAKTCKNCIKKLCVQKNKNIVYVFKNIKYRRQYSRHCIQTMSPFFGQWRRRWAEVERRQMLTTASVLEDLMVGMRENKQILVATQKRSVSGPTIEVITKTIAEEIT